MVNRIIQFGTSRFLQAHADLFVHEAQADGQAIGPITVVKTTLGGLREGRIAALANNQGFPVQLRGFENGHLVDRTIQVRSVTRALDANEHWLEVKSIFAHEAEIVISNVGETGYDLADETVESVPKSFPAKLLALLFHRFENGAKPLMVLPCELIGNNGQVLRQLILDMSLALQHGPAFRNWIRDAVTFYDTLVDRIVSEAIEPIGAIGEPYGLWAIKRKPGQAEPFQNRCVVYTEDLEPYLRLKLHILNLGHTFLANIWNMESRNVDEKVREILQDDGVRQRLQSLYVEEVIPGFAAYGMKIAAVDYVAKTVERFENPFLNHRLSDIFQNHSHKIDRRIADFMVWAKMKNSNLSFPQLEALVFSNNAAKNTCEKIKSM